MIEPLAPVRKRELGFISIPPAQHLVLESLASWPPGLANVTVLTGEPGMGKTTLLRAALDRLKPRCQCVYTFWTAFDVESFLGHLVRLTTNASESVRPGLWARSEFQSVLDQLKQKRMGLAIAIDDAHQLSPDAFDKLAELIDLDRTSPPQLKLLLAGVPRLASTLDMPAALSIRGRIGSWLTVDRLGEAESGAFIRNRMSAYGVIDVAQADVEAMAASSGGVPRLLDNLCRDRASRAGIETNLSDGAELRGPELPAMSSPFGIEHNNSVEQIARWARGRGTTWCGTLGELSASSGVSSDEAWQVIQRAADLEDEGVRVAFRLSARRARMIILTTDPRVGEGSPGALDGNREESLDRGQSTRGPSR